MRIHILNLYIYMYCDLIFNKCTVGVSFALIFFCYFFLADKIKFGSVRSLHDSPSEAPYLFFLRKVLYGCSIVNLEKLYYFM